MTEPIKVDARNQKLDAASFVNNIGRGIWDALQTGKGLIKRQSGNQCIIELANNQTTGGGVLTINEVTALPAIPTTGTQIVFYLSAGSAHGNDAHWIARAGYTQWKCIDGWTTYSGAPE
jgi:hypothetical protein